MWWFELVYAFLDENNVWHESCIRLIRSRKSIKQKDHEYLRIEFCELNGFVHEIYSPQQNSIIEL